MEQPAGCYHIGMDWKHPGRSGALLYALAAVAAGSAATALTRVTVAKHRGRQAVIARLPGGPIIVISNHASHADGILLALACRRMGRSLRLLATAGVFRAPGLGWLARRLGFIPVARGTTEAAAALRQGADALAAGEAVGIFPEGRTTRDPHQWPERAKTGAVRLALEAGVPIVPVAMVGTHRVMGRRRRLRTVVVNLLLRPRVLIEIGDPIDVRALAGDDPVAPERVREVSDQVMGRLVALVAQVRNEPAPDPSGVTPTEDD